MNKWGIIAGAAFISLLFGSAAFAGNWGTFSGQSVAKIMIDNKAVVASPPAIVINGTPYVPVRILRGELGHEVKWDNPTRTVSINSTFEAIEPVLTEAMIGKNLPITKSGMEICVTLDKVEADFSETVLHFSVNNGSDITIMLWPYDCQIVTGTKQLDDVKEYDHRLWDGVTPGGSCEGNIILPPLPAGTSEVKVYLTVMDKYSYDELMDICFPVSLKTKT